MCNKPYVVLIMAAIAVIATDCGSNEGSSALPFSQAISSSPMGDAVQQDAAITVPKPSGHNTQQIQYAVLDLGTLGGAGGTGASAEVISNNGRVIGTSTLSGDTIVHGFAWRNGIMTDLGTLGGLNSNETGVPLSDSRGLIAGTSQLSAMDPLAEYWGALFFTCNSAGPCDGYQSLVRGFVLQNGNMTALPTLGGNNAKVTGINDHFQVVGFAENNEPDPGCPTPQVLNVQAVVWQPGGNGGFSAQRLPTFPGDTDGEAAAINDRGQVVGVSGSCSGLYTGSQSRAVLWDHGTVTDMGNLGGMCCNTPVDINSRGQVVGYAGTTGNTTFHAFLWQDGGMMTDLGVLPGYAMSFAFGINDQDDIVGGSCADTSFNSCTAMIWQHGVGIDLNKLVKPTALHLFFGNDINARGEIVAYAFNTNDGEYRAALLIPCNQEPTDIADCEGSPNAAQVAELGHHFSMPQRVREQFLTRTPFGRLTTVHL